jgi:hypothetical protein
MTLPRLDAVLAHWENVPPLSVSTASIAAALGVQRATPKKVDQAQNAQELMDLLGGAGFKSEKPEWLKTAT